ncbi:hypothetical protein BN136_1717 [Cronobacter universalis NCTC 9529]|nr:hypothetical protein BN136_1717 [Cronobacter universalis NCTC 9529]
MTSFFKASFNKVKFLFFKLLITFPVSVFYFYKKKLRL